MINLEQIKKVATHNGTFHADEVTGWVLITELCPDATLIRTRDKDIINSCDLVFDVGGESQKFDHHKKDREVRDNGIFYSAVGLLWRELGRYIILKYAPHFNEEEINQTIKKIDNSFLMSICAEDNGQELYKSEHSVKTYSNVIGSFNPLWNETIDEMEAFYNAVDIARHMLRIELKKAISNIDLKNVIKEELDNRENPEILILKNYYPWKNIVFDLDKKNEILYVIYPTKENNYMVQTMTKEVNSFENRKDLPAEWGGKRDKELEDITGVKGSIFCHINLFLAGADTLEGAIKLANIALKY